MNERYVNEDLPKPYVEYVEGTLFIETVNRIKVNALCKPTIDDCKNKKHKNSSYQTLMDQINDIDSLYSIDEREVLSIRLRLTDALQHVIQALLQRAIQFRSCDIGGTTRR